MQLAPGCTQENADSFQHAWYAVLGNHRRYDCNLQTGSQTAAPAAKNSAVSMLHGHEPVHQCYIRQCQAGSTLCRHQLSPAQLGLQVGHTRFTTSQMSEATTDSLEGSSRSGVQLLAAGMEQTLFVMQLRLHLPQLSQPLSHLPQVG